MNNSNSKWHNDGIRIVRHDQLDHNVPLWPGMNFGAATTHASSGANKIWAGSVTIPADAKTVAHHHGELESVIYVVSGKARMRWAEHLEMNASSSEALVCVLVRNNQEPVVVRLDIEEATKLEEVSWVDPHHPAK